MRTCLVLLCFVDVETTKKVSCFEWKVVEILGVGFHELVCQMVFTTLPRTEKNDHFLFT